MNSKITDMLVSAILKKGILGEARNVDVEFDIPGEPICMTKEQGNIYKKTTIHIKAEHVSVQIEKGNAGA